MFDLKAKYGDDNGHNLNLSSFQFIFIQQVSKKNADATTIELMPLHEVVTGRCHYLAPILELHIFKDGKILMLN